MENDFFKGIDKDIIYINDNDRNYYSTILTKWARHFLELKQKGLIPLFITGTGVSMDVETKNKGKIPDIYEMIDLLKKGYEQKPNCHADEINDLFKTLNELKNKDKKDRSTVARLLNIFQEKENLKSIWKDFNDKLVDIIINTERSPFHEKLADIHRKYGAVTLTLNFDGLLIQEFEKYSQRKNEEKAFSLPTTEECENFFLRLRNDKSSLKEYLEIQIRGDIFYITCDADGFCPQKGQQRSLWAFIASYPEDQKNNGYKEDFFLKCPACGKRGKSFLSFPGSYEKEKDMRKMLQIVWKYLSFRVGSVTVAGCSGEWDPLLIAFLGDLLAERDIPLLVIDKEPQRDDKCKYIIEELVKSSTRNAKALGVSAREFIEDLTTELNGQSLPLRTEPKYDLDLQLSEDNFWHDKFKSEFKDISKKINYLSQVEIRLLSELKDNMLDKISQLGLKSRWLGLDERSHTRYQHSLGVMKIASYLYDAITKKESIGNPYEWQFLRIAALMHDIGHLPFSHLIESVFNELNWKPADYKEYYSHEFQTEKQIDEIFSNPIKPYFGDQLAAIGYSREDLKRLINGCFGVGYLDAIINSLIDSDKIDYVFRDTKYTERKIFLDAVQFLKNITDGLEITTEKHLSFSGISAVAAAQLLEARRHLYEHLYLQPGIVILEGIVKLIIKTYFVHSIDMPAEKIDSMKNGLIDYPDLGEYKINYCINTMLDKMKENDFDEMDIIKFMYGKISKIDYISKDPFKENLKNIYELITSTKSNGAINEFEKKIIRKRIKYQKDKISEIIKDVSFKFPGAAIIEAVKQPDFLSSANSRKERERSDGTNTFAECIIVPKGDYHSWNPTDKAVKSTHDSSLSIHHKLT